MKKVISFSFLLFVTIFLFAKNNNAKEVEKLRQTELAFSKLCGEKGMKESFLFYADEEVIKLNGEGQFPIISKDSLKASFGDDEREKFTLQWYPTKVEVSKSADLGYTFGNWTMTTAENKKRYGIYYTVWKKQKNGEWKFIFDGGNSTPEPILK